MFNIFRKPAKPQEFATELECEEQIRMYRSLLIDLLEHPRSKRVQETVKAVLED